MDSLLNKLSNTCFFSFKTYIGSILVSVNPYKMFNIYGTDMVLQHKGHALGENPP